MLTLLSEIKFLTTRDDDLIVKDTDYGSFRSFGTHKKDTSSSSSSSDYTKCFHDAKKDYESRRKLIASHSHKFKASVKQLEEELKHKKVIYCDWINERLFNLMLSDGMLITVEVCLYSGDIKKLNFDKYFLGKLVSEHVCDVVMTRQHFIISYDENMITFVYLQKPSMNKTVQKISATDPKIFNVVIAPNTTKIKRNMAINPNHDTLILWTKSSQNEFFPWRPSKDQDRANLHVYALNREKIELICYYWTENSPIGLEFSKFNENEIRSIEQKISRKGDVTVECIKYYLTISKSKFQRISVTSIPLDTEVACCTFSPDHEKILMSCIDGSIVLFDDRGTTYLVKASFIPTSIVWHPDSALIVIANERCQLQCFEIALSCVKNQILSEDTTPSNILDLSSYFVHQPKLNKLCWAKKPDINHQRGAFAQLDCFLLMLFDSSIASVKFIGGTGLRRDIHTSGLTADVFIHMYISLNQIEKAVNVLLSLNWDNYGAMCLLSLHKIANFVFNNPSPEGEDLLEKSLGSFYIPVKPLCAETENEFGENVDDIARRFFHYLIRSKSFEKAFRLAIDLNDKDLFILLAKCAKACNLEDLMNESKRRADEIYTKEEEEECESHHSSCSMTSCSICSDSEESYVSDTKSLSDEAATSIKRELIQSTSMIKGSVTSACPPLPKFSEKHFHEKTLPPLPALTSHNLKKFNSSSVDDNLNNVTSLLSSTSPFINRSNPSALNETENDHFQPSVDRTDNHYPSMTKIHNYPLISGSIPAHIGNQAFLNVTPSTATFKRDQQQFPVNSILTNVGTKKESGEKNKVKFSDTITVAVVPEVSRKEKINNFNEKTKRKSFSSPDFLVDLVKRELKESLPLSHPNRDYLKDFLPAPEKSSKNEEKKDKPSIKVVNFGIL